MPDIFKLFKLIDSSNNKPSAIEYLVVGLGNPGKKYDKNSRRYSKIGNKNLLLF